MWTAHSERRQEGAPGAALEMGHPHRAGWPDRVSFCTMPRFLPVFLLLTLLGARAVCAQAYFNNRYANNGGGSTQSGFTNLAVADEQVLDSGYVAIGQAAAYPYPSGNGLVISRLRPDGSQRRVRYYGRPNHDYYTAFGNGFLRVPGGYAMQGGVTDPGGINKAMLWRFNDAGDTIWTRTYGSPNGNARIIYSMCRTRDGGYALTGASTITVNPYNADLWLLRTDSLGAVQWSKTYHFGRAEEGVSIVPTADGGFLIGGQTEVYYDLDYQALVLKVDSLGQEQWRRTFGTRFTVEAAAMVTMLNDSVAVVATTNTVANVNGYEQHRVILYHLELTVGATLRRRAYGPARNGTSPWALHTLADGSVVVAGQCGDPTGATPVGNGFQQGFALKVCPDGDSVWYRTYKKLTGGNSQNFLRDFRPTADGGFVGAGFLFTAAPDTGSSDAWAFKTDSSGHVLPGGRPSRIRCPPPPVSVGLAEEAAERLVDIWPNPAPDGRFTVRAAGGGPETRVTFAVLDARGRTVAAGELAGAETVVDVSRQPPGLYLLRLSWPDGRTATRKLVR